jgi:hypothetical protein
LQGEEWYEMKSKFTVFLVTLVLVLTWFAHSPATVEWDLFKTLKVEKKPRDVAISADGATVFVLTDEGEVLIYAADGKLKDRINVGNSVDGIKAGPREDILMLTSRKDSTVKFITLDFIQEINVSGSPFKGQAEAPVVLTVFNDFQ